MTILLLLACSGDTASGADSAGTVYDSVDTATDTAGLPAYTGLSSEGGRSCVISPTGALACFDVSGTSWSRSQDTPAGFFTHVSAGGCGLKNDAVSCWDADEHGTADPPTGDFTTVERGAALACAPDGIGQLDCWGDTSGLSGVFDDTRLESHLSVSGAHVCGLAAAGVVACDGAGVLGGPTATDFLAVDAGAFGCALDAQGTVSCWGDGAVIPPTGDGWVAVTVGGAGVCARDAAGSVTCTGTGAFAQVPAELPALVVLDAGSDHVCGLDAGGALVCWLSDGSVVTERP
jgi:hypothetical protein